MNVGSGGAPAAAGAAASAGGAAAPAEEKAEEKEEGTCIDTATTNNRAFTDVLHRQGGVRRGYGFRSFRLSAFQLLLIEKISLLLSGLENGVHHHVHFSCWIGSKCESLATNNSVNKA